ncbi:MAG TPA: hypothetical protein VMW27_02815 [Thermoanaerobaculia bacterium]|nr:hypothetical protein [Thermoanaerobaculia bacterium]
MATDNPQDRAVNPASLQGNISLDQLISATSTSVLRALREHEAGGNIQINPKLWVGIWIDLDRFGGFKNPGGLGGPGGGPAGGGGIG